MPRITTRSELIAAAAWRRHARRIGERARRRRFLSQRDAALSPELGARRRLRHHRAQLREIFHQLPAGQAERSSWSTCRAAAAPSSPTGATTSRRRTASVICMPLSTMPLNQVIAPEPVRYDANRVSWVGNLESATGTILTWHTSQTKTMQDAMRRETPMAGTGKNSIIYQLLTLSNHIIGTQVQGRARLLDRPRARGRARRGRRHRLDAAEHPGDGAELDREPIQSARHQRAEAPGEGIRTSPP